MNRIFSRRKQDALTTSPLIPESGTTSSFHATATRKAKPFNSRGFVTFVVALSAAMMLVNGVVLFIAPSGRIATHIHWTLLWLGRQDWINFHNVFSLLFLGALAWHLAFNWKPLSNYVISRATHHLNLKREMLIAAVIFGSLFAFTLEVVPPIDSLANLAQFFRHEYWK